MKRILIALAISCAPLMTLADLPQATPNPETFCSSGCTETMKGILEDFRTRGAQPNLSAGSLVSSGACYHIQRGIDPNQTHHGLSVLDANNGQGPLAQGVFSFFTKEDPWAGMNFEKARDIAIQRGSKPHPTTPFEREFMTEYKSETADIFYWLREDQERKQLLLVSLWTYAQAAPNSIFCRLNTH